jgi:hypothetical protein
METRYCKLMITVLIGAALVSAAMLAGCHKKPKLGPVEGGKFVMEDGKRAFQPERPNPKPQGDSWVFPDKIDTKLGDEIMVDYKLPVETAAAPWIGLVQHGDVGQPVKVQAKNAIAKVILDPAQKEGKVKLVASKLGEYVIRLFPDQTEGAKLLGESEVVGVGNWPQGNLANLTLPYLLIDKAEPGKPYEVATGSVLKVSYKCELSYPSTAWIGVIPATELSIGERSNDAVDVAYKYIPKDSLEGTVEFTMEKPGEYFIRMFPCNIPEATAVSWSQRIIVK